MRAVILSFALVAAAIGPARAEEDKCIPLSEASPKMVAWLKGEWANVAGPSQAHQYWSAPINGILIGHEIIATAGATTFTFLRIAQSKHGLSLFVSINGADPVELTATELCSARVVFEGETSAYPSRIVYLNTILPQVAEQKAPAKRAPERRFRPIPKEPLM